MNAFSDFEDKSAWSTLSKSFDNAINDQTIVLDTFVLPEDMCKNFVEDIL